MQLEELVEALEDALEVSDVEAILEIGSEIEQNFPDFDLDGLMIEYGWRVDD
jgi:hypothetical protein